MGIASENTGAFLPYPDAWVPHAPEGPLAGLRLAVKDLFDVAGYPTGAGNAYLLASSGIKTNTAQVVQCLLDRGAEFVGKTVTDELAYSLIGRNIHFGMPTHPAWPERIPGGSSSGSAIAVATGLADIGLGTDTSGSIRLPAAINGLCGWRPTHGLLSADRCRPLAPSFDTGGFLTSSLGVMDRLMDVFVPPETGTTARDIVIPEDLLGLCDQVTSSEFLKLLDKIPCRFRFVKTLTSISLDEARATFNTILRKEAWLTNADLFSKAEASIDPTILARLDMGRTIDQLQFENALAVQDRFLAELSDLLADGSILAFPTLPRIAPLRSANTQELDNFRSDSISLLCISGLSGCPQLVCPFGSDPSQQHSLSLLGMRRADRILLEAAHKMGLHRTPQNGEKEIHHTR